MKSRKMRRALSVALSAALAVSSVLPGLTAKAAGGNKVIPMGEHALGTAQPRFPGYRIKDILNWSPETDPYADMLRARVPLQERNEQFQATQANPALTDDAKVMLMQGDYYNTAFENAMYGNDFGWYTFNYWQYTDMWAPWHGAATAYTPSSFWGTEIQFEYGTINIPAAAYTNAAHKNGVMSIGVLYFDGNNRKGQTINEMMTKDEDGNYAVVDKLVELAEYFGFDGYFINQEESTNTDFGGDEALQEVMSQLTAKGMYTQYYTAGLSSINAQRLPWLKTEDGRQVVNSIFTDYQMNTGREWPNVDPSRKWCEDNGYNIYDIGFFGLECNLGNGYPGDGALLPDGNLKASIAYFTPMDKYWAGLRLNDDNPDRPAFQQARFQWAVAERERIFFTGASQDPTTANFEGTIDCSNVNLGDVKSKGVAKYIAERSVINGSDFYSTFNTGKGMQYFVNGAVSRDEEWTNINIQDIMPTWQWWMETEGTKLNADFDYGAKEERMSVDLQPVSAPFTQVGAYNGGSSLVVYGDLDAENFLHLYKTDLDVQAGSTMELTFQKVSNDDASMKLGLIFTDGTTEKLEIADTAAQSGAWVTSSVDLSAFAGKKIAAIGLVFAGEAQGYQMNVGQIRLVGGETTAPAAPQGLAIRAGYENGEMIVDWDLESYDLVDKYNVYVVDEDGTRTCMGGVYDSVYYIKDTMAKGNITVEVTAVGKDGSESQPAAVTYSYDDNVSNLKVEEALDATGFTMQAANAGYLDVSFTKPSVDYKELKLTLKPLYTEDGEVYTMTVANGEEAARFYIPRGHGEYYDLFVTTVFADGSESVPAAYRGRLRDVWSQPLSEYNVMVNKNGTMGIITPDSVDWAKMYFYADGVKYHEAARNTIFQHSIPIPEGANAVDIIVEDYSGNLSQPLTVSVAYVTKAVGKLDETTVPDAVLRQAMIDQIGSDSIAAARDFTGVLDFTGMDIHDLTGLCLASHAKEIILSGTPIDTIAAGAFGFYVQKVDLSGCKQLRIVDTATFDGAAALREVDITGCDALEFLAITNSSVEKLTYGDAKAFDKLVRLDLSGSCFDLTEGTPEQIFVAQIQSQVSEDKSVDLVSPTIKNLAPEATFLADQSSENESFFKMLTDGNTKTTRSADIPLTMVLDLNAEVTVTGWMFYFLKSGGLYDFEILTSLDGENYEVFSTTTGNKDMNPSYTADEPVKARYVKLHATDDYGFLGAAMCEWELYGNPVVSYPSEVLCGNQPPRLVPTMETSVEVELEAGKTLDLQALLENAKETASVATVRGTAAEALVGADFLAEDYEPATDFDSRKVDIMQVTDAAGSSKYGETLDLSNAGVYTVAYITCNAANVNGEALYTLTVTVAETPALTIANSLDNETVKLTAKELEGVALTELAAKLDCLTKTVDGVEYAFAGWFTVPRNGFDNWAASVATQEDVAVNNTLYAYYINADYLKTTIAYTSNASRATKVFALSTAPADVFANYGFVLSTAASANDENLVIGAKIDGLNVAKIEKTTIYSWISVAPFAKNAPKTANDFNGGLGVVKDGTDGYISYALVTNMPIGKTVSARAYYTTLDGTIVYGSTTQQLLEANSNVTGLK